MSIHGIVADVLLGLAAAVVLVSSAGIDKDTDTMVIHQLVVNDGEAE